jgi:hypothetical protein
MSIVKRYAAAASALALSVGLVASGAVATDTESHLWTGEWVENDDIISVTGNGKFGPSPGVVVGTSTMSDPRVSGDVLAGYQWLCAPNEACTTWGSVTLTNEGGTWEGDFVAFNGPAPGHLENLMLWTNGTGEYEGLSYVANFVGPMSDTIATGQIVAMPLPSAASLSFPEAPAE